MERIPSSVAEEIAKVASAFQRECNGVAPESVTVLLGERTLLVRLHNALSPAEKVMAKTPEGAARVEEYHRQLFRSAAGELHVKLQQILGMEVLESRVEIEPISGRLVEILPSGDLVQVFCLAQAVEAHSWRMPHQGALRDAQ